MAERRANIAKLQIFSIRTTLSRYNHKKTTATLSSDGRIDISSSND